MIDFPIIVFVMEILRFKISLQFTLPIFYTRLYLLDKEFMRMWSAAVIVEIFIDKLRSIK